MRGSCPAKNGGVTRVLCNAMPRYVVLYYVMLCYFVLHAIRGPLPVPQRRKAEKPSPFFRSEPAKISQHSVMLRPAIGGTGAHFIAHQVAFNLKSLSRDLSGFCFCARLMRWRRFVARLYPGDALGDGLFLGRCSSLQIKDSFG